MAWNIYVVENTVKISLLCARDLVKTYDKLGLLDYDPDDDIDDYLHYVREHDGTLRFDPDDMEHMDRLEHLAVRKVLEKHRVMGRVGFVDPEGSSTPKFWGYEFRSWNPSIMLKGVVGWTQSRMGGRRVAITGTFNLGTRTEIERRLINAGASIDKTVTADTDVLYVGVDPKMSTKKKAAARHGTPKRTEADLRYDLGI